MSTESAKEKFDPTAARNILFKILGDAYRATYPPSESPFTPKVYFKRSNNKFERSFLKRECEIVYATLALMVLREFEINNKPFPTLEELQKSHTDKFTIKGKSNNIIPPKTEAESIQLANYYRELLSMPYLVRLKIFELNKNYNMMISLRANSRTTSKDLRNLLSKLQSAYSSYNLDKIILNRYASNDLKPRDMNKDITLAKDNKKSIEGLIQALKCQFIKQLSQTYIKQTPTLENIINDYFNNKLSLLETARKIIKEQESSKSLGKNKYALLLSLARVLTEPLVRYFIEIESEFVSGKHVYNFIAAYNMLLENNKDTEQQSYFFSSSALSTAYNHLNKAWQQHALQEPMLTIIPIALWDNKISYHELHSLESLKQQRQTQRKKQETGRNKKTNP